MDSALAVLADQARAEYASRLAVGGQGDRDSPAVGIIL